MALTEQEKQELKQYILSQIKSESQGVNELQEVQTLDGVKTLPAMRGEELVSAPVSLLAKPATHAAAQAQAAKQAAETAAEHAVQAATNADTKARQAQEATTTVRQAVEDLTVVKNSAQQVIDRYEDVAVKARNGATARFDGILGNVKIATMSVSEVSGVYYVSSKNVFVGKSGNMYVNNWSDADIYMNEDRTEIRKDKLYLFGSVLYAWNETDGELAEVNGTGNGNTINVSELYPLTEGYYTPATAIKAVEEKLRTKGRCVTFEVSQGRYLTKQFVGTNLASWESESSWDNFGGGGTVKSVTLNGQKAMPDTQGNISLTVNEMEVDETLNAASTNPVQNKAVAAKLSEVEDELDSIKNLTLDSDVEPTDEGSKVTLSQEGRTVAEFTVAGGGGATTQATRAVVLATLSHKRIKPGDKVSLTYGFTHYVDGEEDGTGASLTLEIRKGTSVVSVEPLSDVVSGMVLTFDLTKYITTADTYSVSIVARYEYNGEVKVRKTTSQLSVVDLSIALYNEREVESYIAAGGYKPTDPANIIVSVKGGSKEIAMYIDGNEDTKEVRTLTGSNGRQTFTLSPRLLSPGSHSVQFVASIDGLKSNSLYMDVLVSGGDTPFVGLLYSRPDGLIMGVGDPPTLLAYQYEGLTWKYIAVGNQSGGAASLTLESPKGSNSFVSPRTYQAYNTRMMKQGVQQWAYILQDIRKAFRIEVSATTMTGVGIKEGATVELDAEGRSNVEANPAVWTSGNTTTRFVDVDFSSSGWSMNRENGADVPVLRLINGAKAEIDYKPFATDAKIKGLTLTFEVKMSYVRRADEAVLSCFDREAGGGFAGFFITPSKVKMPTGGVMEFVDEEGNTIRRDLGLEMPYAHGEFYSLTLVVHPENEERTLRLYINGVLSKAETYQDTIFAQRVARGLLVDSTWADVELRHIRAYETALTDDEVLTNYITDRFTLAGMEEMRKRNDVLSDATGEVSHDKLRSKGKATLTITMEGGVEKLWGKSTDTKSNYAFDEIIFRSPFGKAYDLKVTNGAMRRQGTSTSTYPIKNLRIYLDRKGFNTKVYRNVGTGSEDVWEEVPEKTYVMREGAKAMSIINLKTDYADSSMCYNTGTAILLNDYLVKNNPSLKNKGMQPDDKARMAIDGLPIDVFTSDSTDGEKRYCGQFLFNNDKSKSGYLFGQTKKDGSEIALEFINNMNPTGNFHITGNDVRAQLDSRGADGFDAGVEFLFPEKDYLWNGDTPETTAPENIKQAVVRLWQWVHDCTPQGADPSNMSERDVKQAFVSEKFKREVSQYFDVTNLTLWWVLTDYHLSVDQRVKNTFFRTWGDGIWWLTYYDGDTAFGKRNDAFLSYDYNVNRDTRDLQRNKFAFEGHNSRLWCLVLANLDAELKASAKTLRATLTNEVYKHVFNTMMMGNWSERQYNKSGIYKYIKPTYTDYNGGGFMNYIFALNGNMYAYRNQLIERRFSLLDAKYNVGQYESDVIAGYIGKGNVTTQILATAGDEYYFGWKTQNGKITDHQAVNRDDVATFSFTSAISQNDPIRLIGASRMRKIDLSTTAAYMQGAWNLNGCKMLEELVATTSEANPTAWFPMLRGITCLRHVDLTGQKGVTGTEDEQARTFDVSSHSGLTELKLGGTSVRGVKVAGGSPLQLLELPNTLTTLRLKDLPKLTMDGLIVADWGSVTSLDMGGCDRLDWKTILERCVNVERVRIEGVDITDSGALLRKLIRVKGLDVNGNGVDYCALVGTVRLTAYMEDDEYAAMLEKFPELNIRQPDYTMIEFDDNVPDDANVTNLDNGTGYRSGSAYVPSGHIAAILKQRHRVLAKVTKKATTRVVNMAGQDTIVNNLDGEMTYYPLDDGNSYKYADGTEAKLDGTEGDWMMYEPFFWSKGVNDYLKGKHYSCYSSADRNHKPASPEATVVSLEDIKGTQGGYLAGKKITSDKETLRNSYTNDTAYSVCKVDVSGYRRVRFPGVPGVNLTGAVFIGVNEKVVSSVVVPIVGNGFEAGMYLISDVPEEALSLHFTVLNTAEFDCVVLSNSDRIEDMEPEWVANDEHLCAVVGSTVIGSKLRAAITGGSTTANITWIDFHHYSVQRGMQQIDALMHSRIANLFFAKYGRRNAQEQCGAGQHSERRIAGGTAERGMCDTIGYQEASSVNSGITNSIIESSIHQYAWYRSIDEYGGAAVTQVNNICCLGYEDIYGNKYEMMDGVDMPINGKWRIFMPDGSVRMVGCSRSSVWITAVAHGRYMDVIPVGTMNGSASTYYSDYFSYNDSRSIVIYRSGYAAHSFSGVSFVQALYKASYTATRISSRLGFRGRLVRAQSVAEYKAASEVA